MNAHEKYPRSKPRKGDIVSYCNQPVGEVLSVDGSLCWVNYPESMGGPNPFIWAFKDGCNTLHDWPTKRPEDNGPINDWVLNKRGERK
jgi:hypothetical protein